MRRSAPRDNVDHPLNLYGATKKANELMAHAYAHLFAVPMTGLRFFTVYGPWGRPDMAVWLFTEAILQGKPIRLFNDGASKRDFTYIDDVVEAVVRLIDRPRRARSGLGCLRAQSGHELCALACLQHRQSHTGRSERTGAPDRAGDGADGHARTPTG